jgi:hypothetical protein
MPIMIKYEPYANKPRIIRDRRCKKRINVSGVYVWLVWVGHVLKSQKNDPKFLFLMRCNLDKFEFIFFFFFKNYTIKFKKDNFCFFRN